MCELLGLCFNKEVSFRLAFSGLKRHEGRILIINY